MRTAKYQIFSAEYINPEHFNFGVSEGEKDTQLVRCFVKTQSINMFINNIQNKNFVVAPKGVGKSGLCSIITSEDNDLLPDSQNYLYMNSIHCEEIVERCQDYSCLKYDILSYIFKMVVNHILNKYYNGTQSPISKLDEFFKDTLKLDSISASGSLEISKIKGEVGAVFKNSSPEISESFAQMFDYVESALKYVNKRVIICIDNLDDITKRVDIATKKIILTAFYDVVQLIRKYSKSFDPRILPILFIRDDLYQYIDRKGESDKRSVISELVWNKKEITVFIIKRFLANEHLGRIQKEIKFELLKLGKIKKIFISAKDLTWIDNLSYADITYLFNKFFYLKINDIEFEDWIFQTLCDADCRVNPRTIVDFFDILLKEQYKCLKESNINEMIYFEDKYNVICIEAVVAAMQKLQKYKIQDYVDLIFIESKKQIEIQQLVEHIVAILNNTSLISKVKYGDFGFNVEEFHILIDQLTYYKAIKSYVGKPPYQKYCLAPILRDFK